MYLYFSNNLRVKIQHITHYHRPSSNLASESSRRNLNFLSTYHAISIKLRREITVSIFDCYKTSRKRKTVSCSFHPRIFTRHVLSGSDPRTSNGETGARPRGREAASQPIYTYNIYVEAKVEPGTRPEGENDSRRCRARLAFDVYQADGPLDHGRRKKRSVVVRGPRR